MRVSFLLVVLLCFNNLYAAVLGDLDAIIGVTPGCAVGIVEGNKLVLEQYKGYSSLKYESPIDSDTKFNIGSISKHFTSAVFFQLEKKGVISRNDSLSKFFPNGPEWFKTINLGHLITHESGIPDFRNDYEFIQYLVETLNEEFIYKALAGINISNNEIVDAILTSLDQMSEPKFAPGTKASYSNTGYLLLSEAMSIQSGMEFDELIQEVIFKPYNLSETKIHTIRTDGLKSLATGYGKISLQGNQRSVIKSFGDTGVLTTLRDFSKWVMILNSADEEGSNWLGFLVDPGAKELTKLDDTWYQNGLMISSYKGLVYSHDGFSTDGMVSEFWISPDNNIGYIKFCNYDYSSRPSKYEVFKYIDGLAE